MCKSSSTVKDAVSKKIPQLMSKLKYRIDEQMVGQKTILNVYTVLKLQIQE